MIKRKKHILCARDSKTSSKPRLALADVCMCIAPTDSAYLKRKCRVKRDEIRAQEWREKANVV